jgi:tetrachlorobenzoquinone reductase
MSNATQRLRVSSMTREAEGTCSFELRAPDGGEIAPFTAGAHIEMHLAPGLTRSYSLLNSQNERLRYRIAVNKDSKSRGGSRFMHEVLRVGDFVESSFPRNNFPLNEAAENSVFVVGGIGITPVLSMLRRLVELGRAHQLYYCVRSRPMAAFLEELSTLRSRSSEHFIRFDQEPGVGLLDIAAVVSGVSAGTHLYCCGPTTMLDAFDKATAGYDPARVHVESFVARQEAATDGGFDVVLAKSGSVLRVPAGKTILQVLLDAGVNAPYSCMEGACGSCETAVLEGIPDHRDAVLSREEQARNRTMMICCSGARSARLVLDL